MDGVWLLGGLRILEMLEDGWRLVREAQRQDLDVRGRKEIGLRMISGWIEDG